MVSIQEKMNAFYSEVAAGVLLVFGHRLTNDNDPSTDLGIGS